MKRVEFDSASFGDDVAELVKERGAKRKALRDTGIPGGTFSRLIDGPPVHNIDVILTAAAYFDLRLAPYVRVRKGAPVWPSSRL